MDLKVVVAEQACLRELDKQELGMLESYSEDWTDGTFL